MRLTRPELLAAAERAAGFEPYWASFWFDDLPIDPCSCNENDLRRYGVRHAARRLKAEPASAEHG